MKKFLGGKSLRAFPRFSFMYNPVWTIGEKDFNSSEVNPCLVDEFSDASDDNGKLDSFLIS